MAGSLTETREALSEVEQYLADTLPPLLVVGSLRFLVEEYPDLFAANLVEWAKERVPGNQTGQIEWLTTALRRFSILAELRVLPLQDLHHLLDKLQPVLLRRSPAHYQDRLRLVFYQLANEPIRATEDIGQRGVELDELTVQSSEHLARDLLPLIDKVAAAVTKSGTGGPLVTDEMMTQLLAAAARTAGSPQELNERLEKLRKLGLEADVPAVLRTLGRSLPNWAVVPPQPEPALPGDKPPGKTEAPPRFRDNRLKAMQRIVELSDAPEENSKRFSHMIRTAVEQFNQGALGRAVAILDSARQLVNEGKVAAGVTHPVWATAEEEIGLPRLGEYAADPFSHDLLQRFISFFPGLDPRALLTQLKTGSPRFPRRLLIALLQVAGDESRRLLLDDIARITEDEIPENSPAWDYLRDAGSLLAALAVPEAAPEPEEVDIVARLTGFPAPLPAFREVLRYFEVVKSGAASAVLLTLLKQAKTKAKLASHDPDETIESAWLLLIERILTRLAVYDNPSARQAVLENCIGSSRLRGVSPAPLAGLGSFDLAADPKSSKRLLAELKVTLPFPLFRWLRKRREKKLVLLLRALSGTSSTAVKAAFEDIARRFPDASFGQFAGSVVGLPQPRPAADPPKMEMESAATLPPVVPSTPAPLEDIPQAPAAKKQPLVESHFSSFDLPALLQHLARQRATGLLELLGPSDEARGNLVLDQGNVCSCSAGALKGEEALFLLMEKPVNGRFRLVNPDPGASRVEGAPLPLLACLMEGMRRHDEYRQACLIVPDDAVLLPTPGQPTAPEEETDLRLLKPLWEKAVSGKTAVECEIEFLTDPYRVRRVLSHWVAEGALRPAA